MVGGVDQLRAELEPDGAAPRTPGVRSRGGTAPRSSPDAGVRARRVLVGAGLAALCLLPAGGCGRPATRDALPPLGHAFESPEAVAEAVLGALAEEDGPTLVALALSEMEFRTVVWPELPSSRPERGLPFEYAWGDLHQKSTNELRRLLARAGGRQYELLEMTFDGESTRYETFTVHRDSRLRVRDAEGAERDVRLFGSVLQRGGEYKLFSYVVD